MILTGVAKNMTFAKLVHTFAEECQLSEPMATSVTCTIDNGKPGPLTKKLQSLYLEIIHRKVKIYNNWLTYVSYNNHCAKSKEVSRL